MKQTTTQAPNLTHANAASICHMALKTVGLRVRKTADYREGYDFMVEDNTRIAVRYAIPTSDRQQVYRKRNGELSHYSYKRWTFNFHRHGKRPERYCDYFVCFLASAAAAKPVPEVDENGGITEPMTDVTVFVIPWEAITGLTFCSSMREGSTRPYRGKYAIYQDAWEQIGQTACAGSERPASTERKRLRISSDSRRRLRLIVGPADGSAPGDDVTEMLAPEVVSRAASTQANAQPGAPAAGPKPSGGPSLAQLRPHID